MGSYENFARVYDELMDNVPYEEWADFILAILKKNKITDGLVLELGCGTGKLMSLLGNAGFDMIGVDNSVDMLQIAREKTSPEFLYLLQDMREFELYGTVKAVVSVCDSVNYITEKEDLTEVFRLVNNYLDPKGLFIFDFNTDYKYRDMIGETVIAEDREDVSFIWFNEYDEESQLNDIDLKVFVQEDGDCYRKFQEEHIQRGYSLQEIKQMLEESGLVFLQAFDEYRDIPAIITVLIAAGITEQFSEVYVQENKSALIYGIPFTKIYKIKNTSAAIVATADKTTSNITRKEPGVLLYDFNLSLNVRWFIGASFIIALGFATC